METSSLREFKWYTRKYLTGSKTIKIKRTEDRNINSKLTDINPTLEIFALKVNILNIPIKNQRLTDGFFKNTVFIFQLYVVYKRYTLKDTSR